MAIKPWIVRRLMQVTDHRPPDFVIGGTDDPYLRRWWLIPRNRFFNVYLHHFMRSDDDRALHDHPWWNVSILLKGSYIEHVPVDRANPAGQTFGIQRSEGAIVFRRALAAHRVELKTDWSARPYMVWTLFLTGPRLREWGFWCPKGFRHWRDFTSGKHGETIGKGCGE